MLGLWTYSDKLRGLESSDETEDTDNTSKQEDNWSSLWVNLHQNTPISTNVMSQINQFKSIIMALLCNKPQYCMIQENVMIWWWYRVSCVLNWHNLYHPTNPIQAFTFFHYKIFFLLLFYWQDCSVNGQVSLES